MIHAAFESNGQRVSTRRVKTKVMSAEFDVMPIVREVIDIEKWWEAEVSAAAREDTIKRILAKKR